MLKKRIVATVVVREGIVVQSIGFSKYLPIGKPAITVEYLNQWGIDEIILLDISATKNQTGPDYGMIKDVSKKCFVPLTVGGGITGITQIRELMHCGADKVSFNQTVLKNPEFITKAAHIFGNQCVVVSIDAVKKNDEYLVYDYLGRKSIHIEPSEMARMSEEAGAGEILINSVNRDGSYIGYDHDLINSICLKVSIPVIGCGGAKHAAHMIELFQNTTVSAACAGNFFHFLEHSVNLTKAEISKAIDVRLETHANYQDSRIDDDHRLMKKTDTLLEDMLYIRMEKEII